MSWWPFNRNRAEDSAPAFDVALINKDTPDDSVDDVTHQDLDDVYKGDLPKSIKKDAVAMKRLKRADKRSKRLYDNIDSHINSFRNLRTRIELMKSKKTSESANT
jgi:hypothetical protein